MRIVKNIIDGDISLEEKLREKESGERERDIEYLLELVRCNPNITEEMIRPDLRKYLGIVKREYKKEISNNKFKNRVK